MTRTSKIQFVAHGQKWRDGVNGNTYHSVRITRTGTGETIAVPMRYGYGDHYRQTALEAMLGAGWIPAKYGKKHPRGCTDLPRFERDNDYPIQWTVTHGLRRDCVANGVV